MERIKLEWNDCVELMTVGDIIMNFDGEGGERKAAAGPTGRRTDGLADERWTSASPYFSAARDHVAAVAFDCGTEAIFCFLTRR